MVPIRPRVLNRNANPHCFEVRIGTQNTGHGSLHFGPEFPAREGATNCFDLGVRRLTGNAHRQMEFFENHPLRHDMLQFDRALGNWNRRQTNPTMERLPATSETRPDSRKATRQRSFENARADSRTRRDGPAASLDHLLATTIRFGPLKITQLPGDVRFVEPRSRPGSPRLWRRHPHRRWLPPGRVKSSS